MLNGWRDAPGARFQVDADVIGSVAKRTSQTDMKRRKRSLPRFSVFRAPSVGGGVWMHSGKGGGLETQRGCWWRAAAAPPCQRH